LLKSHSFFKSFLILFSLATIPVNFIFAELPSSEQKQSTATLSQSESIQQLPDQKSQKKLSIPQKELSFLNTPEKKAGILARIRAWYRAPLSINIPKIGNTSKIFYSIHHFMRKEVRLFVEDTFGSECDERMLAIADMMADTLTYIFVTSWLTPGAYLDIAFMSTLFLAQPLLKHLPPINIPHMNYIPSGLTGEYGPVQYSSELLKITYFYVTKGFDFIGFAGGKLYEKCTRPYLPKWIPKGGWREWFIFMIGLRRFAPYISWDDQEKTLINTTVRAVTYTVKFVGSGVLKIAQKIMNRATPPALPV
jgi:hypothetical protein